MSFNRKLQMGLLLAAFIAIALYSFVPAQAQDATPTPFIIVITATPSPSAQSVVVIAASSNGAAPCSPSVVVKPGDDLYRIALAAGTSWPVLQALNHIPNPNVIYVGQVICLPASTVINTPTPAPTLDQTGTTQALTTTPTPGPTNTIPVVLMTNTPPVIVIPPVSVTYPTIGLNTYRASSGNTLIITGVNFPASSPLDIYLNPLGGQLGAPVASTVSAGDGSLSVNFTIPNAPDGTPLRGLYWTITVRARVNGYFGFTSYTNTQP